MQRLKEIQSWGMLSVILLQASIKLVSEELRGRTEQFLVLELHFAQNVQYFEDMLSETRQILEFSSDIQRIGEAALQRMNMFDFKLLFYFPPTIDDFIKTTWMNDLKHCCFQQIRFSLDAEGVDFYLASKVCGAMLITAPTSTFGWWLAFFIPNQDAVFYSNDNRRMGDKVIHKDLFLYEFGSGLKFYFFLKYTNYDGTFLKLLHTKLLFLFNCT
uniref:P4Hc domain-containing protein n=1 Tax=Angiostrongylus cantonensis TaxID=6313 RepID=A0A0K0DPV4_ANGCA